MPSPAPVLCPKGATCNSGPFTWLLASTLSSAIGRNGYYIASVWILVEAGYGSAAVAVFLSIVSVTELIASPMAGMAADRFDRRWLSVAADFTRFIAVLGTAWALLELNTLLTICLSAVIFSFCDRVALTATQSMLPAIARYRKLAAANSLFFFVMQFGNLGAALLSGILLQEHPPSLTFAVLSVFFFISAGFMVPVRTERVLVLRNGAAPTAAPYVFDPALLRICAVYSFLYAGAVLVSVMGSSFVFEEQDGAAADFGHLEAVWSVGSILGAVLLVPLNRATGTSVLLPIILAATAVMLMALKFLHAPWTLVVFASLGVLYNLGRVGVEVSVQSIVPDHALGRAKATVHSGGVALGLLVFCITAAAGDKIDPSTVFFSFGVVLFVGISVLSVSRSFAKKKNGRK